MRDLRQVHQRGNLVQNTCDLSRTFKGRITRQQTLPEFEDIIQYLDYLNLDEPIIGLDYIVEILDDGNEASGLKYSCRLCSVQAGLSETVHHLIGRKHRRNYLMKKRPDLATWDKQSQILLPAKVIRTKAEVAERQDGRGTPKLLPSKIKTRRTGFSVHDDKRQRSYNTGSGRYLPDNSSRPSFSQDSRYLQDMLGDTYSYNDQAEKIQRATLSKSDTLSQAYIETGERLDYQRYYDKSRETFSGGPEFHDHDKRRYTDDLTKSYASKDLLKEFYTEELKREKQAKAQQPPHLEDSSQQWPCDRYSYQHKDMSRAGRQSASDLETKMSSFATDVDGRNSREMFKMVKDYQHNVLAPGHQDEAFSNPGPSRVHPSRPGDLSRKMPDIPDPFMRFLQGGTNREEPGVRKKKSRFADATIEELQAAKASFMEDYGLPGPKFPSLRQPQLTDLFTESQAAHRDGPGRTESYQGELLPEHSESAGDAFDMLKNIEIENAEEANFLKEKLCSVLKEFKARKSEKTAQTSQGRAVIIKDYNNLRPVTVQGTQDHYERLPRENSAMGRAEDHYNDLRQSDWEQREHIRNDSYEYPRPVFGEPRRSRSPIKEVNRWPKNQQQATVFDKPARFPEMYREPLQSQDYKSADEYFDYQSSSTHLPMERGTRMHRASQYSRNLDKITYTLLEMVARK